MASLKDELNVTNIDKLENMETFQVWNFQIKIFCKSSGLYEILIGELQLEVLTTEKEKNEWNKKDAQAQKLIITTIDKKVLTHIMTCETAAQMYKKLCDIYGKDTEQQKCSLLQEFFNFSYEKGVDMSLHISQLENLAFRLKALNQNIEENMLISKIITTLPEQYRHFRSAWESTPEKDKTLTNLTSRLIGEEKMLNTNENEGAVAFNIEKIGNNVKNTGNNHLKSHAGSSKEVKCFSCGKIGHFSKNCFKNIGQRCKICKKTNHQEKNCYFRNKNEEKKQNKVAFLSEMARTEKREENCQFVIDSGATAHMVNDINLYQKQLEIVEKEVGVAKKNASMKVHGKGTVVTDNCVLEDVLYVPDLTRNLLSVKAITEKDGQVTFKNNKVYVSKNNSILFEGEKSKNGLYLINLYNDIDETSLLTQNKHEKLEEWHRKLGHLSISSMRKLTNNMTLGFDINKKDCVDFENPCEVCIKAKHVRLPFITERYRSTRPLEILHMDIAGPIDPETFDGKKYFLTVLDDFTHYTVVYLLKYKNEAQDYIKEYVEEMEAFQNLRVSKIRCDNGGEFVNNDIKSWCRRKGIVMDITIPYTPQLNGKAERLNRTLLDKARSLIFDSGIEKTFWGEAIRVAAYLLNRCPSETVPKTPYEIWTNRKPNFKRLQIFGSEAYAKVLGPLKKLEERSKKYIFIGYALNGYRLFDEQKEKIVVYRDVIFKNPKIRNLNTCSEINVTIKDEEEAQPEKSIDENQLEETFQENTESSENLNDVTVEISSNEDEIEEERLTVGQAVRDRRGRQIRLPKKYDDYEFDFIAALSESSLLSELPTTYEEAIKDRQWELTIQEELDNLNKNETWDIVPKPKNERIIDSKWVFTQKYVNGTCRKKARLVAKGFQQQKMPKEEMYTPVARMITLRILLSIAVEWDLQIHQMDVKGAFLNGELKEPVFMYLPKGISGKENMVCKLKRSLYGLNQSPKCWYERFNNFMKSINFNRSNVDPCLYCKINIYLLIWVDDLIIMSNDKNEIDSVKNQLRIEFEMKDLTSNKIIFLGLEIEKVKDELYISQKNLIEKVLDLFLMTDCKPSKIPSEPKLNLLVGDTADETLPYKELIGCLMYIMLGSRPDLCFSVTYFSQFQNCFNKSHWIHLKRVLRYLKSTKNYVLKYKRSGNTDMVIKAYVDADFAYNINDRKSISGFLLNLNDNLIFWKSKKQATVALSSCEAEYVALSNCVTECIFIKQLLENLLDFNIKPIVIYEDNMSCIKVSTTLETKRSKHIDIRHHFVRDCIENNTIVLKYIPTDSQVADMMTKALPCVKFENFRKSLNVVSALQN